MASKNPDALMNQTAGGSGQFHARAPGAEPIEKGGHKPGIQVGNDAVPEFSAKTLPAGSAPADRTFKPNNASETPPVARFDDNVDADAKQELPKASDTVVGATSADVHTGLGHPGSGQTSQELHGGHKREGGLEGRGATQPSADLVDAQDPKFAGQRALNKDDAQLKNELGGAPAQDLVPESAETVASEK